jgi:hypothetical protein
MRHGLADGPAGSGVPEPRRSIVTIRGPSPIRAKTYAKEPPRLSICDDYVTKRGRVGGTP